MIFIPLHPLCLLDVSRPRASIPCNTDTNDTFFDRVPDSHCTVDGFLFRYPDNDSDKATEASHGDPAQEPAKQQSRETRAAPVLRVAGPSREALTGPVLRRRPLRDRRGMARGRTRHAVGLVGQKFSDLVCRCLVGLGDSVHRLAGAVEKPQNIPPRYPGDTSMQISCLLRVDPSSVFSPRSVLFFASRASTPLPSRLSRAPRASFPKPRNPPPPLKNLPHPSRPQLGTFDGLADTIPSFFDLL